MSETGYHRRKNPEQVRLALLEAALKIAARSSLQGVTLQAVADAAGVTKGGLLHHFPNKEALIAALKTAVFEAYEGALERRMARDPVPYGRFSRAYIHLCLTYSDDPSDGPTPAEMVAFWSDPNLRRQWYDWMEGLEAQHAETDGDRRLKLVRLAADGLWLAVSDGQDGSVWMQDLLSATYPVAQ